MDGCTADESRTLFTIFCSINYPSSRSGGSPATMSGDGVGGWGGSSAVRQRDRDKWPAQSLIKKVIKSPGQIDSPAGTGDRPYAKLGYPFLSRVLLAFVLFLSASNLRGARRQSSQLPIVVYVNTPRDALQRAHISGGKSYCRIAGLCQSSPNAKLKCESRSFFVIHILVLHRPKEKIPASAHKTKEI